MRTGNFSELLDPNNGSSPAVRAIIDPEDRTAVPRQHHSSGPAEPERHGDAEHVSRCRRPVSVRARTTIISSDNPQDQRKDNIRFDYRLNDKNQFSYRYGKYSWVAVDAFRGTFPFARTDWDRPNVTQTASWTSAISSRLINEFSFTHSLDEVFINVWRGHGPVPAEQVRDQLSVHLPGEQGDPRQDPDDHDRQLHRDRRRSLSGVVARTDLHVQQRDDVPEGPAHVQGRA